VHLGVTTTTGDTEGEVLEQRELTVSEADILAVLPQFTGPIAQVPGSRAARLAASALLETGTRSAPGNFCESHAWHCARDCAWE